MYRVQLVTYNGRIFWLDTFYAVRYMLWLALITSCILIPFARSENVGGECHSSTEIRNLPVYRKPGGGVEDNRRILRLRSVPRQNRRKYRRVFLRVAAP